MIALAALLFAFAGLAAVCASMAKHQPELAGRKLIAWEQRALRLTGAGGLALAFACAVAGQGAGFGAVLWTGDVMLAALALTLLLPYRPTAARRAAAGAAYFAPLLVAAWLVLTLTSL